MASITKLYLRDATWQSSGTLGPDPEFAGTLPGTASLDGVVPDVVATGASTNRQLKPTAGSAQTSGSLNTLAQTASQSGWLRRFVSDPLNAQTIGAQSIVYSGAFAESNNSSDFLPTFGVYIWRPSDGTKVATLVPVGTTTMAEPATTQTARSGTATSVAGTASAGDVLVVEVWRGKGTQVTSVSRSNTTYHDGATEASTTDVAAFVSFATAVSIQTRTDSATTASLGMAASLTTSYIAAPVVNPGLVAVLTHTE